MEQGTSWTKDDVDPQKWPLHDLWLAVLLLLLQSVPQHSDLVQTIERLRIQQTVQVHQSIRKRSILLADYTNDSDPNDKEGQLPSHQVSLPDSSFLWGSDSALDGLQDPRLHQDCLKSANSGEWTMCPYLPREIENDSWTYPYLQHLYGCHLHQENIRCMQRFLRWVRHFWLWSQTGCFLPVCDRSVLERLCLLDGGEDYTPTQEWDRWAKFSDHYPLVDHSVYCPVRLTWVGQV